MYIDNLQPLADVDVSSIKEKDKDYGGSWKKRGGAGAFFMLSRKWDRIETQVSKNGWDVFKCIREDQRPEGILDDIRDLRRYLLLVEAEMSATGAGAPVADIPCPHGWDFTCRVFGVDKVTCSRCGKSLSKPYCGHDLSGTSGVGVSDNTGSAEWRWCEVCDAYVQKPKDCPHADAWHQSSDKEVWCASCNTCLSTPRSSGQQDCVHDRTETTVFGGWDRCCDCGLYVKKPALNDKCIQFRPPPDNRIQAACNHVFGKDRRCTKCGHTPH